MTKEELREKRNQTIESLNYIKATLGLDELYIDELEKENAELRGQCLILADCNTCTSTCKTENIEMKKQLTEAKDLIDKLLHCGFILPCYKKDAIIVKAEQFIKDSEVEK